jgi:hypothetical protein
MSVVSAPDAHETWSIAVAFTDINLTVLGSTIREVCCFACFPQGIDVVMSKELKSVKNRRK